MSDEESLTAVVSRKPSKQTKLDQRSITESFASSAPQKTMKQLE